MVFVRENSCCLIVFGTLRDSKDIYGDLPGVPHPVILDAIKPILAMGAAMDSAALKKGVMAHVKAIGSVDGKGVTSLEDYTAINAAIGHMVASVPAYKTLGCI